MNRLMRTILLVACISFFVSESNGSSIQGHVHTYVNGTLQIEEPLADDSQFLMWFPWKKPQYKYHINKQGEECVERPHEGSSIDEFPADMFTQEERQSGFVVLHFLGAIYFFSVSGMVINYYFIPSVQCICNDLKITPDVGAAVFMATATATPEMFTNIISTFIAQSEMGLGTIIGSLMFNILGVAAISSLANKNPTRMDWVPVTRDCVVFALNVIVLVIIVWDSQIWWYEAMILLILAIVYYATMFQSHHISRFMKRKFEDEYGWCMKPNTDMDIEEAIRKPSVYATAKDFPQISRDSVYSMTSSNPDVETFAAKKRQSMTVHNHDFEIVVAMKRRSTINRINDKKVSIRSDITETIEENQRDESDEKAELERKTYLILKGKRLGLWGWPSEDGWARTIFWFYSWPIRVALRCTMPNPKINRRWYPYTFCVCVVYIALITYLLFWMLIIIGHTFSIPEAVMGLTIFAIGGCTPEMITGVIMARRGHTGTGIANSIGASTIGIVLALGIPWAISAGINYGDGRDPFVTLHSYGVQYVIMSLFFVPIVLFILLSVSKFRLLKRTGVGFVIAYLAFVVWACLVELDVLIPTPERIFCDTLGL